MGKFKEQFGGKLTAQWLEQYSKSPQWKNDKFMNLEETQMNLNLRTLPGLLYKQIFDKKGRIPLAPIEVVPLDVNAFLTDKNAAQIIWYGHSVIVMRIHGKTIVIDPMLGPNASPIAPFQTRRFSNGVLSVLDPLPEIDLLLMTHDHYDHLDYESMQKLKGKVKEYGVALGVKRHLTTWGISDEKITEWDWWDNKLWNNISITFTPTRHFSGRGISDRSKSLWGGWAFHTTHERIWFSGDGGYGKHFLEIGRELGPFDFGFIECGQYNENWQQIHMLPEEGIQAALDAKVSKVMPVHWAGFALALHSWKEPAERFVAEAQRLNLAHTTPRIGELFSVNDFHSSWWEGLE